MIRVRYLSQVETTFRNYAWLEWAIYLKLKLCLGTMHEQSEIVRYLSQVETMFRNYAWAEWDSEIVRYLS